MYDFRARRSALFMLPVMVLVLSFDFGDLERGEEREDLAGNMSEKREGKREKERKGRTERYPTTNLAHDMRKILSFRRSGGIGGGERLHLFDTRHSKETST